MNRRKVIVHIATNADGHIARSDGDLEWLTSRPAPKGFYGMNAFIKSIDTKFIKQDLVERMVKFAEEHDVMVIAEGVERAEELETVKQLGVPLVQGFFLHRPDLVTTFGLPAARVPR